MLADLTAGERAIRCLLGETVDHVPYGVGLGWLPWGETHERWRAESGRQDLDLRAEFGFEHSFAIPGTNGGILPPFDRVVLADEGECVVVRNEQGITARCRKDGGSIPQFLDYPVKTTDDWEQIKSERLRIDEPGRVFENWDGFRERIAVTGEAVQVGSYPYGAFGAPRDLMGAEGLLVSFHDQPDLVRDMMEHLTSLWIALWEKIAAELRIDHIHIWEDMSGRQGSLISPAMIEEFMMPCYDRIAEFARAHGVRLVSVDSDGDCADLVSVMTAHGVNAFLPFEVQAGNNILDYRREYPSLGIIGGLDKRALAGTREDIDAEVTKARQMMAFGGYIPGFDHLIPPDVPWDNFRYAAEKLRAVCYNA